MPMPMPKAQRQFRSQAIILSRRDFGFVTTRMLIAVTVPVILSLMVQRFIVRGLTFGAVKG